MFLSRLSTSRVRMALLRAQLQGLAGQLANHRWTSRFSNCQQPGHLGQLPRNRLAVDRHPRLHHAAAQSEAVLATIAPTCNPTSKCDSGLKTTYLRFPDESWQETVFFHLTSPHLSFALFPFRIDCVSPPRPSCPVPLWF